MVVLSIAKVEQLIRLMKEVSAVASVCIKFPEGSTSWVCQEAI